MKRISVFLLMLLLAGSTATASEFSISSGVFTSSKVISAKPANLVDIGVQTDGTADVTVLIYDNATAASGKIIAFAFVKAGSYVGGWDCPVESIATNGLYASVAGTGVARILVSFKTP